MKKLITLSSLLLLLFSFSCSNQKKENNTATIKNEIDSYLTKAMELHNIPGLALAVIKDDEIVYKNYFGESSLENNKPVNENTLFRVFSATKLITSTGIFQLIQDKQLSLEDKISKYINDLPQQWQEIKIENLLSHSSGLPDIIRYKSTLTDEELMKKLFNGRMNFAIGNQFQYNQTNYWLLAQIIEKVTKMSFDDYILKNQFDNSTNGVLFSSNSLENIPNRATRYFYNEKTKEFEKDTNNSGVRGHSGNGLNITLKKFIEWNKKLDDDILLSDKMKTEMWEPFSFTNQKDHFLHGWNSIQVNGLNSYGFSGGNLAAFRKFTDNNTTIILLSNGYKIPAYDIIINDIARISILELKVKKLTKEEDVMSFVIRHQLNEAIQSFKKLKEENPNSDFDNLKWNINSIGNSYVYSKNNIENAIDVFKFNAEVNPNWWVSKASLAEAYEMKNDSLKAIKNYKKAILLNESNEWNYNEQMKNKIAELKNNIINI
ncbi:serine hydrolase domain-containing protein [Tenacibaculum discolor]|uniref:serine hydrolase domain-containing protein n=1 Tax=Tenacibaculum discolor TaxID=361581 RepID=UPI000EB561E5|nr:serine hydrolase domain-containing protein [Tenacibaculum discolor]RLK02289.1 CubicO group peptidase (beta-lactamase class C family) [Tenacibaculum discolor]